MFITREGDYALRIIRALADGTLRQMRDICASEQIPQNFAYKILRKLEHGGMIRSYRGVNGGYRLERELAGITMYDVLSSVEQSLFVNECMEESFRCPHNVAGSPCHMHRELCEIQGMVVQRLKEKSMAAILEDGSRPDKNGEGVQ